MEKYGKIKGLTSYYESNYELLQRGLMLRYVNDDVSFDIENKIDFELEVLRENPDRTDDYKKSYADLTYWKYKFLISDKNRYGNIEKALYYLKKAYKAGSGDAIAQYGYFYYTGRGPDRKKDQKKGVKLFKKALEKKGLFVEFLIAEAIMCKFKGDEEEYRKALAYYEIALEKKVLECRERVAYMYLNLEENLDKAEKLFKEIATENNDYSRELKIIADHKRKNWYK